MTVRSLKLERFRSFADTSFNFEPKTALIGDNGAGKSNLIEALRLLSVGKSFKSNRLDEAIRFNEPFFRLELTRRNQENQTVEFFYGTQFEHSVGKERQLRVNKQLLGWNEFWGQFPSVLFIPTDLEIIIGSPQVRRRYIDGLLWQTDREFRQSHLELSRVLRERSALLYLLKINRAGPDELSPWNELLVELSQKIRTYRRAYVAFLTDHLTTEGSVFTSGATVTLRYEENPAEPAEVYKEELRLAQNLVGPHRDELEIFFDDQSARRFTSRGQARAIVIMLKVAEATFLQEKSGQAPLILLDDMFSELDRPTAQALFNRFGEMYQIVASSIEPNSLTKGWHQVNLP